MLQQTQVPRVLIKWQEWLALFPTEKDVAQASTQQVLLAWKGMGYNNRALRLKACCEHVATHGWPTTPETLEELPGLGKYTAHAIACFAFGKRVPIVDVNVRIVYAPFLGFNVSDEIAWRFAKDVLPHERFYDYNQALFDLGTTIRSGDLSTLPRRWQILYKDIRITKKKSTERLYGGFPMRLYRGALVQYLRDATDHRASLSACKDHLAQKLAPRPLSFIKTVASKLEKDGIVRQDADTVTLAH